MLASILSVLLSFGLLQSSLAFPSPDDDDLNPYPGKPRLVFRPDGTFKITVFTDLHFGEKPNTPAGPESDRNTIKMITRMIKEEAMDFAVINGDLVTGEETFQHNSTNLINQIVAPFTEAKKPFSCVYGNHDNQVNINHAAILKREMQVAPTSYTRQAASGVGGQGGEANYWVPVYNKADDKVPILVLWFFDSRSGEDANNKDLPDYVDPSVGDWLQKEVKRMDAAWGPSSQRSAMAFVHIPPSAIKPLQNDLDPLVAPGLNEDKIVRGDVQDKQDTKQDVTFWDALNTHVKNLRVIVSGHDHGDEWCAREPKKDVIFCFAKHSSYSGYTKKKWGRGVRNFLFKSSDPKEGIESWVRLEEGRTRARVILDESYGRPFPEITNGLDMQPDSPSPLDMLRLP